MTRERTIWRIHCKDCDARFSYDETAAAADARLGRTPPERCPAHRRVHSREYRALGISHGEVLQLRPDGVGGLGYINRERGATVAERRALPQPDPLPIDEVIGNREGDGLLLDRILNGPERAFVVVGPTGSGKSTWLPLRLLRCERLADDGPICVTEPRIVATEGPAAFVGHLDTGLPLPELGTNVNDLAVPWPCGAGLSVGFVHGNCKVRHDAYNRLIFMTDGTLLNQIRSGEIGKYSVIMIDEAHERSVNIDVCLMALQYMLPRYPRLRVIIASATVNESLFAKYFGGMSWVIEPDSEGQTVGKGVAGLLPGPRTCCVARSAGFTHPILQVWGDEVSAHFPREAFAGCFGDPFLSPSGWQPLPGRLATAFEPLPCLMLDMGKEDHLKPRYYPEFEELVVNIKSDLEEARNASDQPAWHAAIRTLQDRAKARQVLAYGKKPQKAERDAAVPLVAERMAELALRDEHEAAARQARWERWSEGFGGGRLRPRQPAARGNVLGFLATKAQVTECAGLLTARIAALEREGRLPRGKTVVLRAWGGETTDIEGDIEKATREPGPDDDERRLVVATNVAETSLTLPNLIYTMDSGLAAVKQWNSGQEKEDFRTIPHSRAGLRQRAGRVGRKEPGVAFRLYTREQLGRAHQEYSDPGILRERAEEVVLNAWSLGIDVRKPGVLLQTPEKNELRRALQHLQTVGALSDRTPGAGGASAQDVTRRGLELLAVQGDFHFRPLLMEADRYACLWEMVWFLVLAKGNGQTHHPWQRAPLFNPSLAAAPSAVEGPSAEDSDEEGEEEPTRPSAVGRARPALWFEHPWRHVEGLAVHRAMRQDCCDDLELLLRIVQGWLVAQDRSTWAWHHFVQEKVLIEAEATVKKLLVSFDDDAKGYQPRPFNFAALDKVRLLVASAFPDRRYQWQNHRYIPCGTAPSEKQSAQAVLHPDSCRARRERDPVRRGGQDRQASVVIGMTARWSKGPIMREVVCLPEEFWAPEQVPVLTKLTRTDVAIRFAEALTRLDDPAPPFASSRLPANGTATPPTPPPTVWPFPRPASGSYPMRDESRERALQAVGIQGITRCVDGVVVKDCQGAVPRVVESSELIEDTHQFRPEIFVRVLPGGEASRSPALLPARLIRPDARLAGKLGDAGSRHRFYREAWNSSMKVIVATNTDGLVEAYRYLPKPVEVRRDSDWMEDSRDLGGFLAYHQPGHVKPPYDAHWKGIPAGWRLEASSHVAAGAKPGGGEVTSGTATAAPVALPPPILVGEIVEATVARVTEGRLEARVTDDGRAGQMFRSCALAQGTDWGLTVSPLAPGKTFHAVIVGVERNIYWLSEIHRVRDVLTPGRTVPGTVIGIAPMLVVRIPVRLPSGPVSLEYALPPTYQHNCKQGESVCCKILEWPDYPGRLRIRVSASRKG